MSRYFFILVIFTLSCLASLAQVSDIPKFKIVTTENKYFENKDFPKNKPVVLVYFAPDCDHCIVLMDEIFKKIHQFDKAFLLLVTFKSPQETAAFAKKYNVARYPNIKVGTEGTSYVLRNFYKLEKTPFTALYNKAGKMMASYKNDTPVNELVVKLNKIK